MLAALLGVGVAIPVYIVLWIVMPAAAEGEQSAAAAAPAEASSEAGGGHGREATVLGAVLLGAGLLLLAGQLDVGLGAWRVLRFSWPLALIAVGIAFLLAAPRRR